MSTGRQCRNRMLQKRKVNRSRRFSDFNSHPRDHRAVQFKLKRAVEAIGRECQVSRVTTVLRVIGDEQSKVVWKGFSSDGSSIKAGELAKSARPVNYRAVEIRTSTTTPEHTSIRLLSRCCPMTSEDIKTQERSNVNPAWWTRENGRKVTGVV